MYTFRNTYGFIAHAYLTKVILYQHLKGLLILFHKSVIGGEPKAIENGI